MKRLTGRITSALPAAAFLLLGCQSGTSTESMDSGANQADNSSAASDIAERVSGYLDAIARADVEAAGDYWTEDARLLGPSIDLDRSSVLEGMRTAFGAGSRVDILDRSTVDLFVHDAVAYEIARSVEVFYAEGALADTMRNNLFVRWERGADGLWRFDRAVIGPQAAASE